MTELAVAVPAVVLGIIVGVAAVLYRIRPWVAASDAAVVDETLAELRAAVDDLAAAATTAREAADRIDRHAP